MVAVLVVAVGAAFFYKNLFAPPVATVEGETHQVSFICDDTSYFVAHFTAGSVLIDVDGEIVQQLPLTTSTSGAVYGDADWTLTLRGEGATVTRNFDNKSGNCHQPFNPNLAPYNWGD